MKQRIIVIPEYRQAEINPAEMELITSATQLSEQSSADISIILAGSMIQPAAEQLAVETGCMVLGLELGDSIGYMEEQWLAATAAEIQLNPPNYVCIAHTVRGVSLAGALAARLDAACITGVEQIVKAIDGLHFQRSTCGGKFVTTVASNTATTILTFQLGASRPFRSSGATEYQVEIKTVSPTKSSIKLLDQKPAVTGAADLADATVIIAAGQGIGGPETLDLIRRLAACFANSAVAGSRTVCDLGWLNYSRQIGISGNTVAPDLYFACGISGAVQHLMGMRGSKCVVAVNTDPNAAIFREADLCIVEDVKAFIPAFIDALDQTQDE